MPEPIDDLEALQAQAEVEKIYREAVNALFTIALVHMSDRDGDVHVIDQLCREFPGSTQAFWYGVMEMVAEEISDDGLVPDADDDPTELR